MIFILCASIQRVSYIIITGLSETSGPHTLNVDEKWRTGSCGPPMPGAHLKIDNPDDNGEGEVFHKLISMNDSTLFPFPPDLLLWT